MEIDLKTAAIIVLIFACFGLLASRVREPNYPVVLPKNTNAEIKVTRRGISILEEGKAPKHIHIPKTGSVKLVDLKSGQLELEEPSPWPSLSLLPHLDLSISTRIEPSLGIQFVRSEAWQLGISLNITPSYSSISLDRDIFANGRLGLHYGIDKALTPSYGLSLGLFL